MALVIPPYKRYYGNQLVSHEPIASLYHGIFQKTTVTYLENKKTPDFSFQDAMRLAQTDTGKQLQALLQKTNPDLLRTAQTQAADGN
ncbi:MAG: hypothetical protein IKU11_00815, partial [Clostridia bacterium]|nr:hypothetical protein [Clostridia bacterium]